MQTSANAECSWIGQTNLMTMLTWTCKSADSTVGLLGAYSTCPLIAAMCNSKQTACAKEMKQPTTAS